MSSFSVTLGLFIIAFTGTVLGLNPAQIAVPFPKVVRPLSPSNAFVPYQVTETLRINNAYDGYEGKWGPIQTCNNGSYAMAIEIKYLEPAWSVDIIRDEVAVTGVKLYCYTKDGLATGYVTSTVGDHGSEWYGMGICDPGAFLTDFKANVLQHGGLEDEVAVEDVEAMCDHSQVIDGLPISVPQKSGKGFKEGVWSDWASCTGSRAICGLQVLYDDGSLFEFDAVGVADFTLFCCDL